MAADCAERILETYASEREDWIAAVAATNVSRSRVYGDKRGANDMSQARQSPGLSERMRRLRRNAFMRWVFRDLLLFTNKGSFVPYDSNRCEAYAVPTPPGATPLWLMAGHTMTVRRNVALTEPFENHLLGYAPAEDLDCSYRWGRHGAMFCQRRACLYHHQVATARIKRKQVVTLTLLNILFFVRRSSSRQLVHGAAWTWMMMRRFVADLLRDLIRGRITLPHVRGVLHAAWLAPLMFLQERSAIGDWYEDVQAAILKR